MESLRSTRAPTSPAREFLPETTRLRRASGSVRMADMCSGPMGWLAATATGPSPGRVCREGCDFLASGLLTGCSGNAIGRLTLAQYSPAPKSCYHARSCEPDLRRRKQTRIAFEQGSHGDVMAAMEEDRRPGRLISSAVLDAKGLGRSPRAQDPALNRCGRPEQRSASPPRTHSMLAVTTVFAGTHD